MVRNVNIYLLTILSIILTAFIIMPAAAVDTTSPASISNLHMNSRGTDYIDWGWTDPTTSDFNHVDVYINGVYKGNVSKGILHYRAKSLTPGTIYTIGTHTVDNSGNVNSTWKNSTKETKTSGTLRFMTIGDPHLSSDTTADQDKRLTKIVNLINSRSDVDLTVVLGDIVSSPSDSRYKTAMTILGKLNKPYYVIPGNHDISSSSISKYNTYFGPAEHIENLNGYQLIFVGIKGSADNYEWSFDYSKADKSKPTVIFNHGPVQPKVGSTSCSSSRGSYFGYACDMKPQVDSFAKLLGFYNGHVHVGDNQVINGERYVTQDNIGGYDGSDGDSNYIGYTKIVDGNVSYSLVRYQ